MAVAPEKAAGRVEGVRRSMGRISMLREEKCWAWGEVGSRVRPRIRQPGRVEKNVATEPP